MSTFWKTTAAAIVMAAASYACGEETSTPPIPPVYLSLSDDPVAYETLRDADEDIVRVDTDSLRFPDSPGDDQAAPLPVDAQLASHDESILAISDGTATPWAFDEQLDTGCSSCEDAWAGACDEGCDADCGPTCTGCCPTCCGLGMHCTYFYGEYLYLRARNAEVAYAVPADGPIVGGPSTPIQVGSLGILDPGFDSGYRAGLSIALDTISSFDLRYTQFENRTNDQIEANAPNVLHSLVTHPGTATAAEDALAARGSLAVDFDVVDFSYRHLLNCGSLNSINYVLGARYARLEQQFAAEFIKNGTEYVTTDIDFDGGGMRLGLEATRYSCRNCLNLYANGYASLLAGRFRGNYFQGDSFDPEVVDTSWEAGRIVPILDLECGVGWTSATGKLGVSVGYLVSSWFNTVTSQELIDAVQRNNYLGMSETVTFDGLQARFHLRF